MLGKIGDRMEYLSSLLMKRFAICLLSLSSTLVITSACTELKDSNELTYSSQLEAELACESWSEEGGTWSIKINDFMIADRDQELLPIFPVQIGETKKARESENLDLQPNNNDDLSIYLPLFSSNKRKNIDIDNLVIQSTGEDKWLQYTRRFCHVDNNLDKVILGKEYLVEPGVRILDSKVPSLETKRNFFYE